jgi:hypothetical protein
MILIIEVFRLICVSLCVLNVGKHLQLSHRRHSPADLRIGGLVGLEAVLDGVRERTCVPLPGTEAKCFYHLYKVTVMTELSRYLIKYIDMQQVTVIQRPELLVESPPPFLFAQSINHIFLFKHRVVFIIL